MRIPVGELFVFDDVIDMESALLGLNLQLSFCTPEAFTIHEQRWTTSGRYLHVYARVTPQQTGLFAIYARSLFLPRARVVEFYVYQPELPPPPPVTIADRDTGVNVAYAPGVFPGDIVMHVVVGPPHNEIVDGTTTLALAAWDIYFTVGGAITQPAGMVTVRLPIPASFTGNSATLLVLHVVEGGTSRRMETRVEGNYLVFETNHFSSFQVIELQPCTDNGNDIIHTERPRTLWNWILFFVFFGWIWM